MEHGNPENDDPSEYRQGPPRPSSATAPDTNGSPDAIPEEVEKNPSKRQRARGRSGKSTSELSQREHVEDPAGTKPKGMKQSPIVSTGTIKNDESMQLKEAVVESNSGDTPLPIGEIPTNQRATGVGSSGGGLPPEMTGMSCFNPTGFSFVTI